MKKVNPYMLWIPPNHELRFERNLSPAPITDHVMLIDKGNPQHEAKISIPFSLAHNASLGRTLENYFQVVQCWVWKTYAYQQGRLLPLAILGGPEWLDRRP